MADVFDSADDMRDFAANFFESFFFGGGFPGFKGGGGGGGGGEVAAEGDDAAATGATGGFGAAWTACKGEMKGAELIYGVDCPLPPALGAARLVAWYNVNRREAMAEMRLFDL
jgi:hypothetical protein